MKWPNCQNNTSSLNKYWLKNKNRVDNDKVSPILNLWMSSMLNVSVSCCELKPQHRVYRSLLVWLSDRPLHCSVPMEDNHRQSRVTMNSFLHSSISRRALQTHLFSQHKRSHLLWCHCQRLSFVSVAFRNSTPSLSLVLRLNCKKRGEVRSACFWIMRKRFSHEKCTCVVGEAPYTPLRGNQTNTSLLTWSSGDCASISVMNGVQFSKRFLFLSQLNLLLITLSVFWVGEGGLLDYCGGFFLSFEGNDRKSQLIVTTDWKESGCM